MSRDRSLEEFATGDGSDENAGGVGADADVPVEDESGNDEVEPIASTYRWSPHGGVCDVCGSAVETRWREDEALVCEDCKAW